MKKLIIALLITIFIGFTVNAGWQKDADDNSGWMDGKENSFLSALSWLKTWGKIDCDNGTDPESDTYSDTVTFISGNGIVVTGNSAIDEITWKLTELTSDWIIGTAGKICQNDLGCNTFLDFTSLGDFSITTDDDFSLLCGDDALFDFDFGHFGDDAGGGGNDTYVEIDDPDEEIRFRSTATGSLASYISMPWKSGDTKATLFVGSSDASNDQTAITAYTYDGLAAINGIALNNGYGGIFSSAHNTGLVGQNSNDGSACMLAQTSPGMNSAPALYIRRHGGAVGYSREMIYLKDEVGMRQPFLVAEMRGSDVAELADIGALYVSDELCVYDGDLTGDKLVRAHDHFDDGILDVLQNDAIAIRLHGNGTSYVTGGDFCVGTTSVSPGVFGVHGASYFSDDIVLRDGGITTGDLLVKIYDSADDGSIQVYRNNQINHEIHGNSIVRFNVLNTTNDFVIESDTMTYMFVMDSDRDGIAIGCSAVDLANSDSDEDVRLQVSNGDSNTSPYNDTVLHVEDDTHSYLGITRDDVNNADAGLIFGDDNNDIAMYLNYYRDSSGNKMMLLDWNGSTYRSFKIDNYGYYMPHMDNGNNSYYVKYNSGTGELTYYTSARWHKDVLQEKISLDEKTIEAYLSIPTSYAVYKGQEKPELTIMADNAAQYLPSLAIKEITHKRVHNPSNPGYDELSASEKHETIPVETDRWEGVKYDQIPLYNREIIKRHENRINELETRIEKLENQIERLLDEVKGKQSSKGSCDVRYFAGKR